MPVVGYFDYRHLRTQAVLLLALVSRSLANIDADILQPWESMLKEQRQ